MATPLGSYSFLPWLRQGIAGKIVSDDHKEDVKLRPTIKVQIEVSGDGRTGGPVRNTVDKDIQLYGPGDIVGIRTRDADRNPGGAIIRIDPPDWTTNFEANFLPSIEFYDEDFPWRYTPAKPTGNRLRPWIALVVLKEGEFTDGTTIKDTALPSFVTISDRKVFPPAKQLWAWAHVHVNGNLAVSESEIVSTDMTTVLPKLETTLKENRDSVYSRILCPRRLEENAPYHAFIMPVFESGRLAGLGLDLGKTPYATHSAWEDYPEREERDKYPYYYRWYFRTGSIGDFEYLVRLLQPKPVDKRVGIRDLDVQRPGANIPGITKPGLNGVLKLGGALRVPLASLSAEDRAEIDKYDTWATPYPQPFQSALASFINLADDYTTQSALQANAAFNVANATKSSNANPPAADTDPLITAPLYGRWHALTSRLLSGRDGAALPDTRNWVHELNLDPRYRASAGFGSKVIQQKQEDYMNFAWEQVGAVEAIGRIRFADFAKQVSLVWFQRHLQPLHATKMEKNFLITAPVQRRVLGSELTVYHQVGESRVSTAAISGAMRRITRPRGRLMQRLPFTDNTQPHNLLARMNTGEVAAAPPKTVPPVVNTIEAMAASFMPQNVPSGLLNWLRRFPWLPLLTIIIGLFIALILIVVMSAPLGWVLAAVTAVGALYAYQQLATWRRQTVLADHLTGSGQRPESIDNLPKSPDFVVRAPGDAIRATPGISDSAEATRFKEGLKSAYMLLTESTQVSVQEPKPFLNLPELATKTMSAIDPRKTIPDRTMQGIVIPDHIASLQVEQFQEPMNYPEFDIPMYKPLYDLSAELFLPNLNLIPENSVTVLETNKKAIESYMIGLNYEFGRELLWREYPSDNRGSYFRQFWDVSKYIQSDKDPVLREQLREKLKNIRPLHLWSKHSALGTHDNRADRGGDQNEAVLVIRGELLKRYPNAVIYAHRATWAKKNEKIDPSQPRSTFKLTEAEENALIQAAKKDLTEAERNALPRENLRFPLYDAKVEPDIYFMGFDLTIDEVIGGTGQNENDAGWFFIIQECPGEPRFGLDINRASELRIWNDLVWEDVMPGGVAGDYIEITDTTQPITDTTQPIHLTEPADATIHAQWNEDKKVFWTKDATSAELAYMMCQAPVQVAIHGAELLRRA